MVHQPYSRKIQVQHIKSSVKGLFPENRTRSGERESVEDNRDSRISGRWDSVQKTGQAWLGSLKTGQGRLGIAIGQSGQKIRDMYRPDGSLDPLARQTNKVADHIRSGKIHRRILYFLHRHLFDRSFEKGLFRSTAQPRTLDTLTITGNNKQYGHDYRPVPVMLLRAIISALPDKLRHFHFIDIGSGAGRAILLASCYPFKKIRGIEFSRELHDISCINLAQFSRSRMKCRDIDTVLQDATGLEIPRERAVFLFNDPFGLPLYKTMLEKIAASYQKQPRRLYLVFIHPPRSGQLDSMVRQHHIFEPLDAPALRNWRCRLLNPFRVKIYRTVYRERAEGQN